MVKNNVLSKISQVLKNKTYLFSLIRVKMYIFLIMHTHVKERIYEELKQVWGEEIIAYTEQR